MNTSSFRVAYGVILALAMLSALSAISPSSAQQMTAPAAQQAPSTSQPAAISPPAAPIAQAPSAGAASVAAPAASDATVATTDAARSLKTAAAGLRELSPWSMFMSADILVKAVMIGLAFASLVTWTIFIAKMVELSVIRRKLRAALGKIGDARSLAEAQFALGAKDSVLSSLLAAAMREGRLSAGIS